jgi:hypothetical protein
VKPCKRTWRANDADGYPRINIKGINMRFSRYLYMQHHDVQLTPEIVIRHTCDNRWCVEIDHLVEGTVADNNQDKVDRDRSYHPTGERNPSAVLTEEDVFEIRRLHEDGWSRSYIAKQFNINNNMIYQITTRRTWKHI